MARKLRWAVLGTIIKDEFYSNSEFNYITIDGDGSVCAWAERPEYDTEKKMWHGDDWFIIGVLADPPEDGLIDYSDALYTRDMYDVDFNHDEPVKFDNFNAEALRKTSNSFVKDVIHNNIKDAAEKAAASGHYSACCWIGWVPPMQRRVHLAEATAELKRRGFSVKYDEDKEHICIEW